MELSQKINCRGHKSSADLHSFQVSHSPSRWRPETARSSQNLLTPSILLAVLHTETSLKKPIPLAFVWRHRDSQKTTSWASLSFPALCTMNPIKRPTETAKCEKNQSKDGLAIDASSRVAYDRGFANSSRRCGSFPPELDSLASNPLR